MNFQALGSIEDFIASNPNADYDYMTDQLARYGADLLLYAHCFAVYIQVNNVSHKDCEYEIEIVLASLGTVYFSENISDPMLVFDALQAMSKICKARITKCNLIDALETIGQEVQILSDDSKLSTVLGFIEKYCSDDDEYVAKIASEAVQEVQNLQAIKNVQLNLQELV